MLHCLAGATQVLFGVCTASHSTGKADCVTASVLIGRSADTSELSCAVDVTGIVALNDIPARYSYWLWVVENKSNDENNLDETGSFDGHFSVEIFFDEYHIEKQIESQGQTR